MPIRTQVITKYYEDSAKLKLAGLQIQELQADTTRLQASNKILSGRLATRTKIMVRNPLRDTLFAGITSEYGFIPVWDTLRGLASLIKKDEYYQAWRISGGELASVVAQDRQSLQQSKELLLKRSERIKKYIKSPIEVLRVMSSYMEQATRIGEARLALRAGADPETASFASREITSDFLRMGAKMQALSKLTAFFNARVQGTDKLARTMLDHPIRTSFRMGMYVTLPSIILYLLNRDEDDWDEIPQWQKDNFWLVKIGDTWWRIPKPFEAGMIAGSLPERFLEALDNDDPDAVTELAGTILRGLVPVPVPTGLTVLAEVMTNYSFFLDRAIVSPSLQNLPQEGQYTQSTSKTAVLAGELLNYSPAKIEYMIRGYFGGLGKYALDTTDVILKGTGITNPVPEPEKRLQDIPVLKAFVVGDPKGSTSNSVNDFYKAREKATQARAWGIDLIEAGRLEDAREYLAEHPEAKFFTEYNRIAGYLSDIRKIKNQIYDSAKLSPAEKRRRIDELDQLMTTLAYRAINIELK